MRFFVKELSLTLIVISALYRVFVSKPLGLDVYLLYLPGLCFAPLLVTLLLSYRWKSRLEVIKLMLGLVVFFLWLCPVKLGGRIFEPAGGDSSIITLNVQAYEADLGRVARVLFYLPITIDYFIESIDDHHSSYLPSRFRNI